MTTSSQVPGGIILADGERVVRTAEFRSGLVGVLLPFWGRSKLALTDRRLAAEEPKSFLWLLPTGSTRFANPLRQIAAVGVGSGVSVWGLLLGIIITLIGVASISQSIFGVILVLIGLWILINAFKTVFFFSGTDGRRSEILINMFDRGDAQTFADEVSTTIAERVD